MSAILEVFNNSLVQAMLLGPVMGVVFSAIFSGATNSPPTQTTRTVVRTKEVYVTKIIERRGSGGSGDNPIAMLVVFGGALLFVLWKYAIYAREIQYWIAVLLLFALAFGGAALAVSMSKGQFTSGEWWAYITPPVAFLAGCLFLLNMAVENFDPKITEAALHNNLWTFYNEALTGFGRSFMVAHVLGVLILCIVILLSFLQLLHYLALMSQRSYGWMADVWFFIARFTQRFAGVPAMVVVGLLFILCYMCLDPGVVATWFARGDL